VQSRYRGLQLHRRRKQRPAAQEALVLRPDLAHNLLAWTRGWLFRPSPFAEAGIYRMVKVLFPIPGEVSSRRSRLLNAVSGDS
jgi:hypothetical protein